MVKMTARKTLSLALVFLLGAVATTQSASAAPIRDYIVLGDSMAFGETNFTSNPSNGDRGYVKPYADYLAGLNGGVRPNVINFGVDGETSSSFVNSTPHGDGTVSGMPAPQLNLNYPASLPTQNGLMLSTLFSEKSAGHSVDTVSLQLGANDLLSAVNAPGFFTMSAADQQAKIAQILGTIQINDTYILSELKAVVPDAKVLMLGYHNPFNADPTSAIGKIADPAIKALNSLIQSEAKAFGATYVDTYTPFVGHELAYTYIAQGNVHPNSTGYALIAAQMEAVPEPSSFLVVGAGLVGWVIVTRRNGRRSAL